MKSASAFPKLSGNIKAKKDILEENTVLSDYLPQFWDSVIAKRYICAQKPSGFTLYEPQPGELTEHHSDRDCEKKNSKPIHLPFGDGGTTVSLTYRGECMQISRYLGCGQSSIFSIEHESLPMPFLAYRRNKSFTHMQRIGYGFGLGLEVPTLNHDLRIQWLRSRWPRLTSEAEGWKLEQQWAVKEGVVIAHSRMHNKSNCDSISTSLAKDLGFRIRELDFVSRDCPFNDDDNDDQHYAEGAGPGGYGFVKIHEFPSKGLGAYRHKARRTEANDAEQPCQPDGVTVVVGFFVNGEPWTIDRIETEDIQIKPRGYTDLVVGYRLALISKQADNRALLTLTAKDLDINEYFSRTIGEGVSLPNEFPLGKRPLSKFFMERNVENILSVCMVPVSDDYIWDYEAAKKGREKGLAKDQILALTCGDLSGHRICHSASYFAFRFLVEVAENIPKDHGLRNRIRDACLGHLRWVLLKAEVRERKYARNYWISGRIMPPSIRLLNDGPTDTPFQILKAYEYHRVFDQTNNGSDVIDILSEAGSGEGFAVVKWLQQLEQEDARNGCVWRHGRRVGMDYYRLDDQAWIWGSLKALSTMLKWNAETRKEGINRLARRYSQNGRMEYNQEEMTRLQQKYDPERVRQEVFNRFPATNPNINGGKMFAVTRSPQESRFEFHSRDTALFYQLGGLLFLDDMNAPWERTLNAQKLFPSKRDIESNNSLRYGLRLLMAVKGFSTNTLHQPAEALEEAQKFIKAGVLTNGLFSNNINDSSEAVPHDYYRDRNLHIPFEMLYIIWSTRDKVTPQKMHATMKDITTRQTIVMSRTPFNNRLDERSLVLLKGEWLYNYPIFLSWQPDRVRLRFDPLWERYILQGQRLSKQEDEEVIVRGYRSWEQRAEASTIYEPLTPPNPEIHRHWLVDISRRRPTEKSWHRNRTTEESSDIKDLWNLLCRFRTADNAKKRLLWFLCPLIDTALMCHLSSPEAEQSSIRSFLDRHAKRTLYLHEKTSIYLNMWETEFHCSFLQFSRSEKQNRARCPILHNSIRGWSPKYNDQELLRASASFRFLGDIFDHYWTCHFFESYFNVHIEPMTKYLSPLSQDLKAFFLDCGDSMWQKRRILEQLLFYRVLTEVNMSTSEICEAIHTDLQQAMQDLDKLTPNEYFKSHRVWISWNEVLDTLTEDLNNIYEMIKEWRVREENRRGNQPRWTKRHEIKYREAVQRSLLLGESAVRDFKVCQTRVASLRKSVTSHREITTAIYNQQMDDRNFRQNDNIKYFTYSTVFFLPLSFATSFFSMQAKPTGDLIRQMIVCTIVAFVILLVILFTLPSAVKEIRNSSQSARTTWKALRRQTGSNNVLHSLHRSLTRYTGGSDNGQNLSEARSGVSDEESGEMVSSGETFNNDTK